MDASECFVFVYRLIWGKVEVGRKVVEGHVDYSPALHREKIEKPFLRG